MLSLADAILFALADTLFSISAIFAESEYPDPLVMPISGADSSASKT